LNSYAIKWYEEYIRVHPDADVESLKTEIRKAFSSENYREELKYSLESRVQGVDESPIQFLFVIQDLCRKVNPNITEQEVINYVTKGLKPLYFNSLMYMESPNMEAFQTNLRKLELKFLMQRENAKKHNYDNAEHVQLASETHLETQSRKQIKSVQFLEPKIDQSTQYLNILTDISQKLDKLNLNSENKASPSLQMTDAMNCSQNSPTQNVLPRNFSRDSSPSFRHTSRRDSYDRTDRQNSPGRNYGNRQGSRSPYREAQRTEFSNHHARNISSQRYNRGHYSGDRNQFTANERDGYQNRERGSSRNYDNRPYNNFVGYQNNTTNTTGRPHDFQTPTLHCQLCNRKNHSIDDCFYNSRSRNFRPQNAYNNPPQQGMFTQYFRPSAPHYQQTKNARRGN